MCFKNNEMLLHFKKSLSKLEFIFVFSKKTIITCDFGIYITSFVSSGSVPSLKKKGGSPRNDDGTATNRNNGFASQDIVQRILADRLHLQFHKQHCRCRLHWSRRCRGFVRRRHFHLGHFRVCHPLETQF